MFFGGEKIGIEEEGEAHQINQTLSGTWSDKQDKVKVSKRREKE